MGSIDKACISGFLCRLCSEMHRIVIHIYGDQGQRLCLVEKINGYLPITISPTDPLPKTICETCLRRVEQHYDLLMRLSRIKEKRFLRVNKPRTSQPTLVSPEMSEDDQYNSEDEFRVRSPSERTTVDASAAATSEVDNDPRSRRQASLESAESSPALPSRQVAAINNHNSGVEHND